MWLNSLMSDPRPTSLTGEVVGPELDVVPTAVPARRAVFEPLQVERVEGEGDVVVDGSADAPLAR